MKPRTGRRFFRQAPGTRSPARPRRADARRAIRHDAAHWRNRLRRSALRPPTGGRGFSRRAPVPTPRSCRRPQRRPTARADYEADRDGAARWKAVAILTTIGPGGTDPWQTSRSSTLPLPPRWPAWSGARWDSQARCPSFVAPPGQRTIWSTSGSKSPTKTRMPQTGSLTTVWPN